MSFDDVDFLGDVPDEPDVFSDDADDVDEAGMAGEVDDGSALGAPFDDFGDGSGLMNAFSEELENVSTSDWDLDADSLWGHVGDLDLPDDGAAASFDFPI